MAMNDVEVTMGNEELKQRIDELIGEEKLLEAARLLTRHIETAPRDTVLSQKHQKILRNANIIE